METRLIGMIGGLGPAATAHYYLAMNGAFRRPRGDAAPDRQPRRYGAGSRTPPPGAIIDALAESTLRSRAAFDLHTGHASIPGGLTASVDGLGADDFLQLQAQFAPVIRL